MTGAVAWVEGQIRRLLTGNVELSDLIMTGGLWRISGAGLPQICLPPCCIQPLPKLDALHGLVGAWSRFRSQLTSSNLSSWITYF